MRVDGVVSSVASIKQYSNFNWTTHTHRILSAHAHRTFCYCCCCSCYFGFGPGVGVTYTFECIVGVVIAAQYTINNTQWQLSSLYALLIVQNVLTTRFTSHLEIWIRQRQEKNRRRRRSGTVHTHSSLIWIATSHTHISNCKQVVTPSSYIRLPLTTSFISLGVLFQKVIIRIRFFICWL